MERSSFFTSLNGDRRYKASDFAEYFKTFIGNGVFPNPSTNLQVVANGDMTITLLPGTAWINGYMYYNTDNLTLTVEHADSVLKRIDRVVLRCDFIGREIKAYIKKGVFATNPVAPNLERGVNAYELNVADILVEAGVVSIQQSKITDTRLDTTICGIVTQTIETIDTTTLFNKLQAYIDEKGQDVEGWIDEATQRWEDDFVTWFEGIKSALGEDVAGNLLNMINEDRSRLNTIEKELEGISLEANRINLEDKYNVFESSTVEGALKELYDKTVEGSNTILCRIEITCDNNTSVNGQKLIVRDVLLNSESEHVLQSNLLELELFKNSKYEIYVNEKDGFATPQNQIIITKDKNISLTFLYIRRYIYGLDINENDSNPETAVTYTDDSVGFRPVRINNGILDLGSWTDTDILRGNRPCLLKNGQVQYYLKPNDYSKKEDGTPSKLDGTDGDVMSEFKKHYYKMWKDSNIIKFRISNVKVDDTWCCNAFLSEDGNKQEKEYMYISCYNANELNGKMVSIKNQGPYAGRGKYADVRSMCTSKGSGYQQLTQTKWSYLVMLITLITKSRDCQSTIGIGDCENYSNQRYISGELDQKGQFYGSQSQNDKVKVFHIESLWNDMGYLIDGLISNGNSVKYSITGPYNNKGTGYTSGFSSLSTMNNGNVGSIRCSNDNGIIPNKEDGSTSTKYCDGITTWSQYSGDKAVIVSSGYRMASGMFAYSSTFSTTDSEINNSSSRAGILITYS